MTDEISTDDVRALAAAKNLPLNESQIVHVRGAVAAMQACAKRLRAGLHRNDEPAFGFRQPGPGADDANGRA